MAGDVRRSSGQWRATSGAPAGGSAPPGAAHLPRTARVTPRRCCAVTGGHSGASACAPDAGMARLVRSRRFQFAEAVFKMNFLWIFKLKCTLWSKAKLKITHPSTTFTKVGRGLMQGIEQEHHAKLAKLSAPVNSEPVP
jgi:hypothetical protein